MKKVLVEVHDNGDVYLGGVFMCNHEAPETLNEYKEESIAKITLELVKQGATVEHIERVYELGYLKD